MTFTWFHGDVISLRLNLMEGTQLTKCVLYTWVSFIYFSLCKTYTCAIVTTVYNLSIHENTWNSHLYKYTWIKAVWNNYTKQRLLNNKWWFRVTGSQQLRAARAGTQGRSSRAAACGRRTAGGADPLYNRRRRTLGCHHGLDRIYHCENNRY